MKRILLLATIIIGGSFLWLFQRPQDSKAHLLEYLQAHRFSQRQGLTPDQIKAMPKKDRPDLAWEQDFLATLDPALGRPAPERLIPVYESISQFLQQTPSTPGAVSTPWVERGPNNVGGRVRAIMYDPNDPNHKKVWAGGVTGGLWYNNDISNPNSQWISVGDFWDNIAVTAIAYDPANTNIFYVGTGEGWGQSFSGARGAGVWKTTNGGQTWTHLSATSGFYFVNDLVVRNESGTGVLYVGLRGNYYGSSWHGSSQEGLQRSTNGGASFTQVMPNVPGQSFNYAVADLEIAADNRLWVGTTDASYGGSDRGGGRIMYSDNGTTWTVSHSITNGERVELGCAPTDANYVYALIEVNSQVGAMVKTTNKGSSWTNMAHPVDADPGMSPTDFSRGQAWYDLIIQVSPTDKNTVLTGAIDLFKSTNAGSSWTQIAHWYGYNGYPNVHADQHAIIFKPGSGSEALFGNDGGIYRSTNINTTSVSFSNLNNGLNITQFYGCALHPSAGSNYMLAGAQDNGTHQFSGPGINSTTEVTGGDGAYCFIDQTNPNIQITSYVYNNYWRSTNGGTSFQNPRMQSESSTGKFINPADYDDNQDALYSARTAGTINRIRSVSGSPSIDFFTVSGMTSMASHLRVSPYTTTSTTLFVGTEIGNIFKITNANGTTPSVTNIGSNLTQAGNISCIELGASENEILVTFSNYGITSVWYSNNGGSTWVSKEGNLPDMPIRWALFNPNNRQEVILATEVGIWSTSNVGVTNPTWTPSNSGLANVRVDMLQIRDSDDMVIAATHGRGVFSSMGFAQQVAPTANFGATDIFPCTGQTVTLSDSSLGSPTSYSWTITPGTFSYVNGTSSSSQNPQVQFNTVGVYTVSMTATNAQGTDTKTRTQFIQAGGANLPFTEDFEGSAEGWMVDNPDNATTWALYTVAGNSPGSKAVGVNNYNYNGAGQRDGLISPAMNLSGYSTATLTFEYAYRRYSSSYQDSMAVYVSTNCGSSWVRVASYKESGSGNFVTGSDITSNFVPSTSSDWCGTTPSCPAINLNAFAGNPNVRIKIENINGYGNNLYVDNVNITGTIGSAPTANFSANSTNTCVGDTIDLNDLSTNNPTGWSWSFSPNTVTYRNGTSSSSQNPKVSFNSAGTYQVSLTATNSNGSDTEVKSGYITVSANLTPTVSITASANNICSGTNVSFTATPVHGGSSPTYQWRRNGVPVGSNSPTFSSNALSNNDLITVVMTSSESCVTTSTTTSNSISMTVTPTVIPSISIQASTTSICNGDLVTFTATPTNGGSTPSYQWKVNGSNTGSNSPNFSTNTLSNNDVVTVTLTSNATCASPATATSQGITISVGSPVTPGVSILASSNTICAGQSVTFTATPTNGGSNPNYQWKVNGGNVGTNSPSFSSSSLSNGDVVSVVMTSSESCVTSSTAGSNSISMNVNAPLTPGVTIGASSTNICAGQTVNFTASPINGGSNPIYQWKVNGVNVGTNSPGYSSSTLANGDQVSVEMTSSLGCVTSANAISNLLSIIVQNPPVVTINSSIPGVVCKQDTITLTGTPAGGTFYGSGGVSGSLFIPILAGSGNHWVYYQYSTSNGCVGRDSVLVIVEIVPKPTIMVNGAQLTCNESGYAYQWMDANGSISGATAQTFTASTNGNYRVEISGASCSDISAPVALNNVHLAEWTAVSGAGLFPNPSNGHTALEIQALRNEAASLELFDASGRIVWRSEILIIPGKNQYSIELGGSLAKGVYSLQVAGESGHFVLRLEIQ